MITARIAVLEFSIQPFQALTDAQAMRLISVHGVTGIVHQLCAGEILALTAMKVVLSLATIRDRAFAVERYTVGRNAALAVMRVLKTAICAEKSAAGIDRHLAFSFLPELQSKYSTRNKTTACHV